MKLYTEEQFPEMLKSTHIHTDNDIDIDMIIPKFAPIELPSDDDVEKKIEDSMCSLEFDTGFESGVNWMRNKIQQKINQTLNQ